jgi:hypothetical protein
VANNSTEQRFTPGEPVVIVSDSPTEPYSTVFEDDGDTAYFYTLGQRSSASQILDGVHIYNVAAVADLRIESAVGICWSGDGLRSALLINGFLHAVFDFAAKRGYSRNDFPSFPPTVDGDWNRSTHEWDDSAMQFFQRIEAAGKP